ncbi:hypothetical protein [Kitasatospora sp. NPDC001175]|uniref:hypothetical protein n=1 Tax=Kitasatospora sp. NPDC001175 TaxID=3157103 RepID=UPI003D0604D4
MDLILSVKNATPEFGEKLLAFLAPYVDAVTVETDGTWTRDRIDRYYLSLPPRAQRILEEAVGRGGYVSADALRGEDGSSSLKGHSAGLKRALDRGVREGWLPAAIEAPVQAQGPGFGKVVGYRIPHAIYDLFRDTVLALPTARRAALSKAITRHGTDTRWDASLAVKILTNHDLETDWKGADVILRHLAETGLIVKADSDRAVYRLANGQ